MMQYILLNAKGTTSAVLIT